MDLHPGEEIVFEGHPSWRSVLLFYVGGIALVAVAAAIGALASGTGIAILAGRSCSRWWSSPGSSSAWQSAT